MSKCMYVYVFTCVFGIVYLCKYVKVNVCGIVYICTYAIINVNVKTMFVI